MEPAEYTKHLESDARDLLAAAWSDPMQNVPTCPDWTLSDLAAHVASALRWVEEMVRTRTPEFLPLPEAPEGWEEVSAWFEEGLGSLLETLDRADPESPVWNWIVMGPGPARFWFRRLAHEASVHRWDAENAVRQADPIETMLALDGVDEYLTIASRWLELTPKPSLRGAMGLETTDGRFATTAVLAPDSIALHRGLDGADCVVRADASDLLLWLVQRKALLDRGMAVEGDVSVAGLWAEVSFG
ncbi:MAG TPA: maleylpyruvate isomerase family mycothiol-dependent enzyme [Acidimicrobiales bacterium]|nr:maleylpyruvate isomerase family mycothiol-dependent enzyme [Acidimicrobiales bacterium]